MTTPQSATGRWHARKDVLRRQSLLRQPARKPDTGVRIGACRTTRLMLRRQRDAFRDSRWNPADNRDGFMQFARNSCQAASRRSCLWTTAPIASNGDDSPANVGTEAIEAVAFGDAKVDEIGIHDELLGTGQVKAKTGYGRYDGADSRRPAPSSRESQR